MKEQKLITLKEAAAISGYDPDYVGQLIRKGKILGKQVYYNVAWTTTEEAIKGYMEENSRKIVASSYGEQIWQEVQQIKSQILRQLNIVRLLRIVLYINAALLVCFIFFLIYLSSISIEAKFKQKIARQNSAIMDMR